MCRWCGRAPRRWAWRPLWHPATHETRANRAGSLAGPTAHLSGARPLRPGRLHVGEDVGLAERRTRRVAAVGPDRVHHVAVVTDREAVVVADERPRGEEARVGVPRLRADVAVRP